MRNKTKFALSGFFFTLTLRLPSYQRCLEFNCILSLIKVQKNTIIIVHFSICGGSYRGRTDTVSLPVDFESTLSANSNKEPRKILYQNNTDLLKEKIDY